MNNKNDHLPSIELSVVIPVYRAQGILPELYQRLSGSIKNVTSEYEIVLIDDGSDDQSWEAIVGLTQQDPKVVGIRLARNFGQHHAITAGLDHARGQWVVVMDCDLQDRPEEIPRLYRKAQEGYDVVLAKRVRRQDPWFKRVTSKIFYSVFNYLTDTHYDGQVGNFRIMSRNVVDHFCTMRERTRFFGSLVDWLGFPSASIEVEHAPRFAGKSTYTYRKLIKFAEDLVIGYSNKPLRLTVKLGFLMALFAFCYGVYIIWKALVYGSPVLGWSSLIVSVYFLSGIIIAILGMIGIYLGKTFDEIKDRPLYVISKIEHGKSDDRPTSTVHAAPQSLG